MLLNAAPATHVNRRTTPLFHVVSKNNFGSSNKEQGWFKQFGAVAVVEGRSSDLQVIFVLMNSCDQKLSPDLYRTSVMGIKKS